MLLYINMLISAKHACDVIPFGWVRIIKRSRCDQRHKGVVYLPMVLERSSSSTTSKLVANLLSTDANFDMEECS